MKKWVPLAIIMSITVFIGLIELGFLDRLFYGYIILFIITVIGGSIIPIGSPIIVSASAALGMAPIPLIVTTAIGFTIGITINYFLAEVLGKTYIEQKMSPKKYEHIVGWWNKWGLILLIAFAFIPFLPFNLLALICGLFKVHFPSFLFINFAGSLFTAYLLVTFGAGVGNWIGIAF